MEILDLLIRRRAAATQKGGEDFPKGYTKYDWIQCNDTAATSYIDTGLKPNGSTKWAFEGSFARTASLPNNYNMRSVFSRYNKNVTTFNYSLMRYSNKTGGNLAFNYNARANTETNAGKPSATVSVGTWHTFELKATEGVSYGGTLILDGTTTTYTEVSTSNDTTTTLKLIYGYPCRLGRFKVYYNGSLYADLCPAMRNIDNVVGFYDLVRETFYPPTGGATFTVGNGLEDFNT